MNVRVGLARPPVKCTESADDVADVRVVDVAVDDVGDNVGGIFSHADLVRGEADADKIVRFEKALQSSAFNRSPARAFSSMG